MKFLKKKLKQKIYPENLVTFIKHQPWNNIGEKEKGKCINPRMSTMINRTAPVICWEETY